MKKTYKYGILMGYLLALSCTYHNEEELLGIVDCEALETDFSNQVLPIIQNNCAIPTCHISNAQVPDLSSYSSIATHSQNIQIRINNGTMPPPSSGKTLTKKEINQITCWIESGSLNN